MAAIFAECRRVLRDDGVLTVMFTHKRAEAWDTLGMGLLQAGFRIETSWPVNTESEQSLHQANKNAAASTDLPRLSQAGRLRWELRPSSRTLREMCELPSGTRSTGSRQRACQESTSFCRPTGQLCRSISSNWPVYSSDADALTGRSRLLRPEEALDAARSEVVRMQRRRLVGTDVQFDAYTDFELIAWETFKAAEFPYRRSTPPRSRDWRPRC